MAGLGLRRRRWRRPELSQRHGCLGSCKARCHQKCPSLFPSAAAGRTFLDDAEGDPVSLADLAGDAAAAAHQRQAQLQQEAWQGGRQLLGWGSNQHAPRMTGVYLGCLENKGGFFPIRDPKSKWFAWRPRSCLRLHAAALLCLTCAPRLLFSLFPCPSTPTTHNACRYVPFEELPDSAVPFAVKYLAGWGVVLSRDLAQHAAAKANLFQRRPDLAPAWFG